MAFVVESLCSYYDLSTTLPEAGIPLGRFREGFLVFLAWFTLQRPHKRLAIIATVWITSVMPK